MSYLAYNSRGLIVNYNRAEMVGDRQLDFTGEPTSRTANRKWKEQTAKWEWHVVFEN